MLTKLLTPVNGKKKYISLISLSLLTMVSVTAVCCKIHDSNNNQKPYRSPSQNINYEVEPSEGPSDEDIGVLYMAKEKDSYNIRSL